MTKRLSYYDRMQLYYQSLARSDAQHALKRLAEAIGDERYQAWCDETIPDGGMPWLELYKLAKEELKKVESDPVLFDRHWSDDPKHWAGEA